MPEFERLVQLRGKVNMLFDMRDFHGWTLGALWEDTTFAMHHFRDIDLLAMIGDRKREAGMAAFCKPFRTATIRHFDHADAAEARTWVGGAS